MRNALPLALTLAVLTACGATPTEPGADVTSRAVFDVSDDVERVRARFELPAMAALAGDADGVVAIGASGLRALGSPAEVTVSDPWHLGSDTKAMTATLVATFVEEGVLAWDMTLPELFPELESVDPGYQGVTLDMLLGHRAGITPSLAAWDAAWWSARFEDRRPVEVQRAELAELLLTGPPTPAVGAYVYSNAGYIIAGAALEALTGQPWEALMRDRVFAPLGMDGCTFGPPADAGDRAPSGHVQQDTALTPVGNGPYADNPPMLGPAGTVACPLDDWARFLSAHATREGLLSPDTYAHLHTPQDAASPYALGWLTSDAPWGVVLSHAGSNTLWYAATIVAPDDGTYYVAVTNAGGDSAAAATDALLSELIHTFSGWQAD